MKLCPERNNNYKVRTIHDERSKKRDCHLDNDYAGRSAIAKTKVLIVHMKDRLSII